MASHINDNIFVCLSKPGAFIVHVIHAEGEDHGLSKALFERFPAPAERTLGTCMCIHVDRSALCLIVGQKYYGPPTILDTAEQRLKWFADGLNALIGYKPSGFYFPFKIGCGVAKGDWAQYLWKIDSFKKQLSMITLAVGNDAQVRAFTAQIPVYVVYRTF